VASHAVQIKLGEEVFSPNELACDFPPLILKATNTSA
jgi:hypothetical protein